MVDGSTRRLPKWLTIGDEDNNNKKKKTEKEENPTLPRKNSVHPANDGTKRKKCNLSKHDDLSRATVNVKSKRKAKNVAFHEEEVVDALTPTTHERILDDEEEEALTVEDLVSIAREYVKDSEDSERSKLLLSKISQPDGSNERQFSSAETRACCIGSTVNSTSEQTFSSFIRTDDPAQDMLNLFLGPLLMKPPPPQGNEMNLDFMYELQKQSQNDFREETIPPTKKKSSLRDRVASLLD